MNKSLIAAALLMSAFGAQAACYTVFDARGKVLSQTSTPPVDMAYQLHQTVPYRFGRGATMSFGLTDKSCGDAVDLYYDLQPKTVAYREGRRSRVRAPRRDRE